MTKIATLLARSFFGLCIASAAISTRADVTSTFDTDADGWVVKTLGFPQAITVAGTPPTVLGTFSPSFSSTGGNPGGYIFESDDDANTSYWYAPSKFKGNQSAMYGGSLSFDLRQDSLNNQYSQEDLIIVGGGIVLAYDTPANPGTTFTSFSVGLGTSGWHVGSLTGATPTPTQMQNVLGSMSDLYIRSEFVDGPDVDSFDNVRLSAPIPEPASAGLLAFGIGTAMLRRRCPARK